MKRIFRAYWPSIAEFKRGWAIATFGNTLFFISGRVVLPYIFARFIGLVSGISDTTKLSDFYFVIFAVFLVHFVQTVFFGQPALRSLIRTVPLTIRHLENRVYAHLTLRSAAFYANNFTGSIVTKFNRFSRSFSTLFEAVTFDFQVALVEFIFPLIFMIFVAPTVAVVYFVWAAIMGISLIYLHRKKVRYSRGVAAQESVKTGIFADTITNIIPLKVFSARDQELKTFDKTLGKWAELSTANGFFGNRIRMFKIFMWTLLEVVAMYFVARQAIEGSLSVTDALAIIIFVRQLSQTMWNFGKVIERVEQAVADASEMIDILEDPIDVVDIEKPKKFAYTHGGISIDNLHFDYENSSDGIFKNLSLDIKPRQKVGLVGPSGGGKTTLVKLLLRFADVQSGSIKIDGHDISEVAQDDLRRAIAYVPQEPILFHRSIKENIVYGQDDVSDKKLAEIIKLSHVGEFIDDLPQGLETMVGERGVKLSGGQKQRIAIARAMLKPAPILLLDEATSALDSKSEKLIIDALDNLMKGRTTIVIAHRLSTIKKLDRIIVLDKGQIKEDGPHAKLLSKKGIYANLWHHQMGNFIED